MTSEKAMEKIRQQMRNARANAPWVEKDAMEVPGVGEKSTIVVFGAGASLQRFEKALPKIARSCLTVVSPTVARWFRDHAGCDPDVMVNVDFHPSLVERAEKSGMARSIPTVLSPVVAPQWTDWAVNPYWFLNVMHTDTGDFDNHPFTWALTNLFQNIKTRVQQMGCVTIEALWLAMLWGHAMSSAVTNIVMAGGDFAFWHGLARVPDDRHDGYPTALEFGGVDDGITWRGYQTNKRMLAYAQQLAIIQKQVHMRLWNMSDGPANDYLPRIDGRHVINGHFPKYWTDTKVEVECQKFIDAYNGMMEPIR